MPKKNSGTRDRVLAAAWRLLEENRGKNVRMGDIAKAAGVSRQAVYLHFKSQTDLMVATVKYGDELQGAAVLVQPWKDAVGAEKLDAWIAFWGNYIPKIFGVAKALMVARESDEAAEAAWDDRMKDVRKGCRKTIQELSSNGLLADEWNVKTASELLWTMLGVSAWEQLTVVCGWSTRQFVAHMQAMARRTFLKVD